MHDRDKVIRGLEYCMGGCKVSCFKCPYREISHPPPDCLDNCMILQDAVDLLKEQEQIVRCKDCKHSVNYSAVYQVRPYKCEKHSWFRESDWFCADGERR